MIARLKTHNVKMCSPLANHQTKPSIDIVYGDVQSVSVIIWLNLKTGHLSMYRYLGDMWLSGKISKIISIPKWNPLKWICY